MARHEPNTQRARRPTAPSRAQAAALALTLLGATAAPGLLAAPQAADAGAGGADSAAPTAERAPAAERAAPLTVDSPAAVDTAESVAPSESGSGPDVPPPAATPVPDSDGSGDGSPRFDVWEYRVLGNTVLERTTIERVLYPLLGPDRTEQDFLDAAARLEAAYTDAGYFTVLVTVPPQDPTEGIVRLQVTEGRVDRLHVKGAAYFSGRRLKAQVPSLQPGAIPETDAFREDLSLLAARSPDRTVQPLAREGRFPGTVEFELDVEDRVPLHFSVEANDRATVGTSRPRLNANVSYDNLFQREHSFGLGYQFTPFTDEIEAFSASYTFRPNRSRRSITAFYLENSSDVTTLAGDLALGGGTTVGLRAVQPLRAIGDYTHLLSLSATWKDFSDDFDPFNPDAETDDTSDNVTSQIDYVVFGANYQGTLRSAPDERGLRAVTGMGAGLRFGIRGIFNATPEFTSRRVGNEANFAYLTANLRRVQPVNRRLAVATRMSTQLTSRPLVANEQLSLGGFNSVRGYFLAEQLADYGALANLELRYTPIAVEADRFVDRMNLYTFYDFGAGRLFRPEPEQESSYQLASLGVGIRAVAADGSASLGLDWAWALSDASQFITGGTAAGDSRVHVSVRYDF